MVRVVIYRGIILFLVHCSKLDKQTNHDSTTHKSVAFPLSFCLVNNLGHLQYNPKQSYTLLMSTEINDLRRA